MKNSSKLHLDSLSPLSLGIFSDLRQFLIQKPLIPTLIDFASTEERTDYCERIMQRMEIEVEEYSVLNIHKIGIDVPVRYVFEEMMQWDGAVAYWPNHLANVSRINDQLDEVDIQFLGLKKIGLHISRWFFGIRLTPLFILKAMRLKLAPDPSDVDNARYLLYNCSGGYPIGIFAIYARSSISAQGEQEKSQLIFVVAFNFYGKKNWFFNHLVNRIWESIHNRATANILNKIKQSYEWKFHRVLDNAE